MYNGIHVATSYLEVIKEITYKSQKTIVFFSM